jgi:hypothetical protein
MHPRRQFLRQSTALAALAASGIPLGQTAAMGAEPPAATTLSNPDLKFTRPVKPCAVLKRGDVEMIVVDNSSVNDDVLRDHRAGYSGVASLTHAKRRDNLFVPGVAGLNFEHILDGKAETDQKLKFEPRSWPMELRVVSEHVAELYQSPTFHHGLESCQRYELLEDGAIQLTIEVVPRKKTFANGYICLFWASYIHQPESLDIHFRGVPAVKEGEEGAQPGWIRGVTPDHGTRSTHPAADDARRFAHDEPFPLTLVFNLSDHRYTEPWYYGESHGLAYVQMFRPRDRVRLTQSPSGGGKGNPAWDFQVFIEDYEVERRYQFVMRAAYLPYESPEQVAAATRRHREALAAQ